MEGRVAKLVFEFPVLMLRLQKPVEWMYNFGRKHANWLKKVGDVAIVIGMFCMPLAMAFLVKSTVALVWQGQTSIAVMVPGLKVPGTNFRLPLLEGLLAILLIATFHEGMHGIMAAAHGLKAKFTSFLLLLVIPAAGVELDEKELAEMPKRGRMRVLAAGSLGNFILAAIAILLFLGVGGLAEGHVDYQGIKIVNVSNPAIGLVEGDVVTGINGVETLKVKQLAEFMDGVEPGAWLNITTVNGTVRGQTRGEDRALLGVLLTQEAEVEGIWERVLWFSGFCFLLFQFNLGVGVINLLPAGFLDGGRMAKDLLGGWYSKVSVTALSLLLFNLVWPYITLLTSG